MEAFFNTALVVALGEMGDKTQVLALLLAARYRRPGPILLGILVATLLTMGVTSWLGAALSNLVPADVLRWVLVLMFFAVAIWMLFPESDEDDQHAALKSSASLVLTAFTTFLIAEMGDKSQVATFVMAAKYHNFPLVMLGSVAGEMLAIVPAVLLGRTTAQWVPLKWVRLAAAGVFFALGCWVLLEATGEL